MNIVFFDFDGTITKKDSLPLFIKHLVGSPTYYFGLLVLSPYLIAYKLNLIKNYRAKERLISYFFKEYNAELFQKSADEYSLNEIDKIARKKALEKIIWHKGQGDKVVVVSASMDNWLKKWCEHNDLELIATQLEIKNGKITGKFSTKNCHGSEKVNRIHKNYDLSKYEQVYAYGDSSGDKEMLALANKSYFKPFR